MCTQLYMNCENLLFMIIFLFKKPHNRTYVKKPQLMTLISRDYKPNPLSNDCSTLRRANEQGYSTTVPEQNMTDETPLTSCDALFGWTLNLHHTPAYPAFINPQHAVLKVNPQKKHVNHNSKSTK